MLNHHSPEIPIFKATLPRPKAWLKYLDIAYESQKFSNFGEVSHELERRVAALLGINSDAVISCVNATQALAGAVATSEQNDLPWTIPSWTFTATASAMISANKKFYFSDIDGNWRIKPTTKKVNLVDVLPFGDDIDIARLESLCEGEIVIDAAASFDALRFSNLSKIKRRFGLVISFHPTKFPAGPEGAVFISNDPKWSKQFRFWTIFGMDERRISFFPGTNAKLNEFSAAVILASLDEYFVNRDNLLNSAERARSISSNYGFEVHKALEKGYANPYWIVIGRESSILQLEQYFSKVSISTRRWWGNGCHAMPAYSQNPSENLDGTELAARSSIALPMFLGMADFEWDRLTKSFEELTRQKNLE